MNTRMNRWSKNGVLDQVFEQLKRDQTTIKVHPDVSGALKKDRRPSENPAGVDHARSFAVSTDAG
jgi:hypothetical protein